VSTTAATATFSIALRDDISGAGKSAAGTLDLLKKKISDDKKALGEMQAALRNLKGGTSTSAAAFKELQFRIAASKASIASAQDQFLRLGGMFGGAKTGLAGFLEEAAKAPGPLGAIASQASGLLGTLGTAAGPIGLAVGAIVALIGSFVALSAAVLAAGVAMTRFAIASASARRSEELHFAGLATLRNWFGATRASAGEMQAALDRVGASSSQSREELGGLAESLQRLGFRGGELTSALEGLSIAQAVQGDRGVARFRAMAAQARLTGQSIDGLTAAYRQRLGPIADRIALGLDVQMRRLHESISGLFRGVHIEGFLRGLNEVLSIFSQSRAVGYALRTVLASLFNPFLDGVGSSGSVFRAFIEGMTLGLLRTGIVILRIRNFLRQTFGGGSTGQVDGLRVATVAGTLAFAALTGVLGAALGVLVAIGAVVAITVGPMLALGYAVYKAYEFYQRLQAGVARFGASLHGVDWSSLGANAIDGFISGLRSGLARIRATIGEVASAATGALRSALDIHSPSRVFASLGVQIPRGLASGIESGAPTAARAVSVLATDLSSSGSDVAPNARGAAPASSATTIGPFYISVEGSNAEEVGEGLEAQLAGIFERLAIGRGAPA